MTITWSGLQSKVEHDARRDIYSKVVALVRRKLLGSGQKTDELEQQLRKQRDSGNDTGKDEGLLTRMMQRVRRVDSPAEFGRGVLGRISRASTGSYSRVSNNSASPPAQSVKEESSSSTTTSERDFALDTPAESTEDPQQQE